MDKKKNIPEIRFKGFTDDWKPNRLGKICLIGDIDHRMPPTVSNGIPYLMTGDFIGINSLNFENTKLISLADYNQLAKKIKPEVGDILFARYASVGAIRYVETNRKFLISYSCAIIKKSDLIYGKYLYYYLQTKEIQHQIEAEINTGSQRNIGIDSLNKINLKLPNKLEQKQIGTFFQNLDNLITLNQKKYDKLVILKKAMLVKMFPKNGALVPEIRFKGFTEDWENNRLENLADFFKGNGLSKNDVSNSGKYNCVLYGHLYTKYGMIAQEIHFSTDKVLNNKILSQFGDVLIPASDTTPTGLARATCIEKWGVILGGDINVIRPKELVLGRFLSFTINANRKNLIPLIKGTTVKHIYNSDLKTLEIAFPCLEEQIKIGKYFINLDRQISLNKSQLEKLNNIKKACFSKMFVGLE
jgi:type I restriction enzyme S subunit